MKRSDKVALQKKEWERFSDTTEKALRETLGYSYDENPEKHCLTSSVELFFITNENVGNGVIDPDLHAATKEHFEELLHILALLKKAEKRAGILQDKAWEQHAEEE